MNEPTLNNEIFSPLCPYSGTPFESKDLILKEDWKIYIQSSISEKGLYFALIAITIIALIDTSEYYLSNIWNFIYQLYLIFLLFLMGWLWFNEFRKKVYFDKIKGIFINGREDSNKVNIEDVESIQIIENPISKDAPFSYLLNLISKSSCYELNLVMKNKKRVNILNQWWLRKIEVSAKTLGDYLWVPVSNLVKNNQYKN